MLGLYISKPKIGCYVGMGEFVAVMSLAPCHQSMRQPHQHRVATTIFASKRSCSDEVFEGALTASNKEARDWLAQNRSSLK